MITDFRTLQHGDTIRDAGNLLLATSQHDFPVMQGNTVGGLLTRAALVQAMLTVGPEGYVAGAMNREFTRISPEQPLSEALPLVSGPGACALVLDADDRLLGMLTSENLSEFILLRQAAVAQQKLHP
jgi:CBS domain-containing protein